MPDSMRSTVHPRACGEHAAAGSWQRSSDRFIPARAGNTQFPSRFSERRFIPARAGNTSAVMNWLPITVHPRACGEHGDSGRAVKEDGSSPRVRGTPLADRPRGRNRRFIPARAGNTTNQHVQLDPLDRFIPARAGNTRGTFTRSGLRFIPACGEHLCRPVVCGNLARFIPARAGNTSRMARARGVLPVHPRACGGTPQRAEQRRLAAEQRFIPARAGNTAGAAAREITPRFIPARAGNTHRLSIRLSSSAVHPRACGEHHL